MNIKQAQLCDIKQLAGLFDQYRVFYQQKSNLKLAHNFLTARIAAVESIIFVAETQDKQEKKLVGFTQLYPSFSSVSAQRTWVLNDLYVHVDYRNLGIGMKLLNRAKAHAEQTLAKGIFLQTAQTNLTAQKLYTSLGYQQQAYLGYFLSL